MNSFYFKKIFLSLNFIFIIPACFAHNFYIGAGLGYQNSQFDKNLTITSNDNTYYYYKDDTWPGTGVLGNIFAGYAWNSTHAYLGTELNASISSLKYNGFFSETNHGSYNSSDAELTLNNSYGLSLLPGYLITPNVLFFGRIGYQRGHFNYSEYKIQDNPRHGVTESENLNGIKYGLGLAVAISKHLNLRLEADQTHYATYTNTTFPMPAGQHRTIQLKPYVNQAEIDLIYQF